VDLAENGLTYNKSLSKGDTKIFSELRLPPSREISLKFPGTFLLIDWQFRHKCQPTAHTAPIAALIHHAKIGKGEQ
jgi:hypothetical protein